MSKHWVFIFVLIVGSVAATLWLVLFDGADTAITRFWQAFDWVQTNQLLAAGIFFLISFISQMIIMPSGSLMLLVAGFALGGVIATVVFSVAQILAAWPVYRLSDHALKGLQTGLLKGPKAHRIQQLRERLNTLKGNDLLATALLRLTPVIPSAGACLLASVCGIRLPFFLAGTALTCWIRPLFFASSGEVLSEVMLRNDVTGVLGQLNLWPLILVFLSVLILFVINSALQRRVGS